jgi:hypothetical protein
MDPKAKRNYRFASGEAATEIRQIMNTFERLFSQKERIDPEFAATMNLQVKASSQRKTHLPNCVVVTRLTVL